MIIHMHRRGFTIVELIIVITVMTILVALGVVNLESSQANGRDAERKMDIESIALQLETYYTSGNDASTTFGYYPPTDVMGDTVAQQTILRDIDIKSLIAPDAPSTTTTSLVVANNNLQTTADVSPQPDTSTSQGQYVYQPISQDGSICSTGILCQKFNLYYRQEIANITPDCPSPGYVCMATSKNQ